MPTNLNALIRYKTIDNCLSNPRIKWTIKRLQEECSEALGEKRGVYKLVSERTIRDDIRVMRSDILDFNAPIVFQDGRYFYDDPNFSIYELQIDKSEIIKQVIEVLLENREQLKKPSIDLVLLELANMANVELPKKLRDELFWSSREIRKDDGIRFSISMSSIAEEKIVELVNVMDEQKKLEVQLRKKTKDNLDLYPDITTINESQSQYYSMRHPSFGWSKVLDLLN